MASLGMNMMHKRYSTDLPGSVNGMLTFRPTRRGRTPETKKRNTMTWAETRALERGEVIPSVPIVSEPVPSVIKDQGLRDIFDSSQWVYATPIETIHDADSPDTVVGTPDDRLLLVYPMIEEKDRVLMRVKSVDPDTGGLTYHRVVVYDHDEDKRYLYKFSLIA